MRCCVYVFACVAPSGSKQAWDFAKKGKKKGGNCWQGATSTQQVETGVITYLPACLAASTCPRGGNKLVLEKTQGMSTRGSSPFHFFLFPQAWGGLFSPQKDTFFCSFCLHKSAKINLKLQSLDFNLSFSTIVLVGGLEMTSDCCSSAGTWTAGIPRFSIKNILKNDAHSVIE